MNDAWEGEAIEDWYASDVASDASGDEEDRDEDTEQGGVEIGHDARKEMLRAPVLSICTALGGYEHIDVDGKLELVYRLGDDCLGMSCVLTRMPPGPTSAVASGRHRQQSRDCTCVCRAGHPAQRSHPHPAALGGRRRKSEQNRAGMQYVPPAHAADLITAMTWPIDFNAEVHDIVSKDEDEDVLFSLVQLQQVQIEYKASVLRVRAKEPRLVGRTAVACVMRHLLLPALAKPRAERHEREIGMIGMCLHFFRNLLAIRDPTVHTLSSTALLANATLQSLLVEQLEDEHVLDTLLMLASNADTKDVEAWAPVAADCIYQLYIGSDVQAIAHVEKSSAKTNAHALAASLDAEAQSKRHMINQARHSRFGTTVQFKAHDGTLRVARTQSALTESIDQLEQSIADRSKRRISRKRPATERGGPRRYTAWTAPARTLLGRFADRFVEDGAFGVLAQQYLRDIHAERERVGDLDAARCKAQQLATFFIEYFMVRREHDPARWDFGLMAQWLEPWAFRLARARAAISLEAKQWLEFVASVRLWTTLSRLLHALLHGTDEQQQVADQLQHALYYDGELLNTSLQVMHVYTAQSFACLEAVLDFAYTMPRLLEKHAAKREYMFVKQRRHTEEEQEHDTAARDERLFRFQTFQKAMATSRLAHVCTQYLARWQDSAQPSVMLPRLAHVAHRIAVKAQRPFLFFGAKARSVWVRVQRGGDPALATRDPKANALLVQIATYLARKFAKLDTASQAAFDADKRPQRAKTESVPTDICVRPGLEHSEQIGVAVGLLAEEHKLAAVTRVKFHLEMASAQRKERMASDPEADPAAPTPAMMESFPEYGRPNLLTSSLNGLRRDAGRCEPASAVQTPLPLGRVASRGERRRAGMEYAALAYTCLA